MFLTEKPTFFIINILVRKSISQLYLELESYEEMKHIHEQKNLFPSKFQADYKLTIKNHLHVHRKFKSLTKKQDVYL